MIGNHRRDDVVNVGGKLVFYDPENPGSYIIVGEAAVEES